MALNSQHVTGFVIGLGSAAVLYYLYKKNQPQIDEFLSQQGIQMPKSGADKDVAIMTVEELTAEKERLEDLIAEKEMASSEKAKS